MIGLIEVGVVIGAVAVGEVSVFGADVIVVVKVRGTETIFRKNSLITVIFARAG